MMGDILYVPAVSVALKYHKESLSLKLNLKVILKSLTAAATGGRRRGSMAPGSQFWSSWSMILVTPPAPLLQ